MKNILLFLLFILGSNLIIAQNITIKGKVTDSETGLGVEAATVYLNRVQDSTLVDYTISDKNGAFLLNVRKTDKATQLKVSHIIYENYTKNFQTISENIDLDEIKLNLQGNLIDSIVIRSEIPPIRIKNDTLEFNASSFKVRPDANVETLLKQLPGVEITADGSITVNGKPVSQVLDRKSTRLNSSHVKISYAVF